MPGRVFFVKTVKNQFLLKPNKCSVYKYFPMEQLQNTYFKSSKLVIIVLIFFFNSSSLMLCFAPLLPPPTFYQQNSVKMLVGVFGIICLLVCVFAPMYMCIQYKQISNPLLRNCYSLAPLVVNKFHMVPLSHITKAYVIFLLCSIQYTHQHIRL